MWGTRGGGGELHYPYDLVLDSAGTVLVAEFGNHRVQRFTRDGRSSVSSAQGRGEGQLYNPRPSRISKAESTFSTPIITVFK